jgi:pilus assembly protein CpaC
MSTALTTTVTPSAATGTRLVGNGKLFGMDVLGALDLGETIGLANTLAEPNLTALSGETAEFLAGGEFPIPLSQGLGTTSIEYKKYGVSLAYTPTVLTNGASRCGCGRKCRNCPPTARSRSAAIRSPG